jgi:DNA topoisomerase-2
VEEIMLDFYIVRYAYYIKRKQYLLEKWNRERKWYEAKIKFLNHFIAKELELAHREDEEIEKDMMKLNIPKLPIDYLSEGKKEPSYDFLLSMEIRSLTKKKKEELEQKLSKLIDIWNELDKTTEKELWKRDIQLFLHKYEDYLQKMKEDVYADISEEMTSSGTTITKQVKKKKMTVKVL